PGPLAYAGAQQYRHADQWGPLLLQYALADSAAHWKTWTAPAGDRSEPRRRGGLLPGPRYRAASRRPPGLFPPPRRPTAYPLHPPGPRLARRGRGSAQKACRVGGDGPVRSDARRARRGASADRAER